MKTVFKSVSDIAHMWANQTQHEAKYVGGNFFFVGDTIYSYGYHFPIAKHVTNSKGEKAVLLTERTYSHTTSNHVMMVRHAASHLNIVYCFNPEGDYEFNFNHWLMDAEIIAQKLVNAKKPEKYLSELDVIRNRTIKYADFVNKSIPKPLAAVLSVTNKDLYIKYTDKKIKYEQAEARRREREFKKSHTEALKKWLNGDLITLRTRDGRDYLRVVDRPGEPSIVETSQGVELPYGYANKLWSKVKNKELKVGDKVLEFTVSGVGDNITIGCHTFPENYLVEFGNRIFKN